MLCCRESGQAQARGCKLGESGVHTAAAAEAVLQPPPDHLVLDPAGSRAPDRPCEPLVTPIVHHCLEMRLAAAAWSIHVVLAESDPLPAVVAAALHAKGLQCTGLPPHCEL